MGRVPGLADVWGRSVCVHLSERKAMHAVQKQVLQRFRGKRKR